MTKATGAWRWAMIVWWRWEREISQRGDAKIIMA